MDMTRVAQPGDDAARRILEIGAEQIPARIDEMRRSKTLSRLMIDLNQSLRGQNPESRATARAALDHLGFL